MHSDPFLLDVIVGQVGVATTMIDTGCLTYGAVSEVFVKKHGLHTLQINPVPIKGIGGSKYVSQVLQTRIDVGIHTEYGAHFYVIPGSLLGVDLMLGLPWIKQHDGRLEPKRGRLYLRSTGARLKNTVLHKPKGLGIVEISAAAVQCHIRRQKKKPGTAVQIFSATLQDIDRALRVKEKPDPQKTLPPQYHEFLPLFEPNNASTLPPHRGPGMDHSIELIKQPNGKDPEVPWGPLYNMSREELIVLRKELTELLDKNFIRVSSSSAAAPVLFVKKPGGGLRFCVDYRALNALTKKDRYPLPLIHETLNQVGRAKWFTKLDVSAAFHKIRITKGQEWLTAFRTRYGLFEWLVTPFGLANAPSTFQKYINWALREYLDEFCSAYLDDVLIFTDGSLDQHREHVHKTLNKLQEAGLYLDIKKCEFECTKTKYLGFVIEAGKGVAMDPEKVEAIQGWEAPTTVHGVRSFLGFANFYRQFIPQFSQLTKPLTDLTHKGMAYQWTEEHQQCFQQLKDLFIQGPVLAPFDPTYETVVETDSSGYCSGGTLSQYHPDGQLHPCAYFSKRHAPAECNYEIHDKELLAVIRCLEAWDAELRSVPFFKVITDHKNLEYFYSPRKLTERHVRWSLFLSKFNFSFKYRKGSANTQADALSRRDQDMPQDNSDERIQSRTFQLLKAGHQPKNIMAPMISPESIDLWVEARNHDTTYQEVVEILEKGEARSLPSRLKLQISLSECNINHQGYINYRNRTWVPEHEPLRTRLIQQAHDSILTGHPGRNETYTLVSREYYWPNMSSDIKRYLRNCDVCGRAKAWRDRRNGLLKPLPVPDQPWRDISLDFITDLPESKGCSTLLVITDRLTRGVILEPMSSTTAEDLAYMLIHSLIRHHGIPRSMVSDRGSQFISQTWSRICQLLKIKQLLSTAYHPQTDGSTERVNSSIETYLRIYVCHGQDNWHDLLPIAEYVLNTRTSTATGMSPFFLSHGYNPSPFETMADQAVTPSQGNKTRKSPIQIADSVVQKLKEAMQWANASLSFTQQESERQANRRRSPAPIYKKDDLVWLNLKNIRTDRPCKKLDWKNAKYRVLEVKGTHTVKLDVPKGIHPVFHVDLIRPAGRDKLPSQPHDESLPPAIQIDGEDEYMVESILDKALIRRGRNGSAIRKGKGVRWHYLVKWSGYLKPTWEPVEALADTVAAEAWETKHPVNAGELLAARPAIGAWCAPITQPTDRLF
jgi:transposase InsO family protein